MSSLAPPATSLCDDGPIFPLLVCINLQRVHLEPAHPLFVPSADVVLANIRRCLDWARRRGVPVAHVHTVRPSVPGDLEWSPAIVGFEPLAIETVLQKRSPSFFDSDEFSRSSRFRDLRDVIVVGFTGSNDCLAAALDATRRRVRLAFLQDAIGSPDLPPVSASLVDEAMRAVISQFATCLTTAQLVETRPGQCMIRRASRAAMLEQNH